MTQGSSTGLAPASSRGQVPEPMVFRLYVAGNAANSAQARDNLQKLCDAYLPHASRVEVIDFLQDPMRALKDGVVVTPTLIKVSPAPVCTVVGTLRDTEAVARALGIAGPQHG